MSALSLIPAMLGRDWWDTWDYPNRLMDQCFAMDLKDEDLLHPSLFRGFMLRPRTQASVDSSGASEVKNDVKEFQVSLNVSQFKPEELEVKVVNNYVEIHGEHAEKSDDHGFISRKFTRKYMLPSSCQMETVASSMRPDGTLVITAPKKAIEEPPKQERQIPIVQEKPKK